LYDCYADGKYATEEGKFDLNVVSRSQNMDAFYCKRYLDNKEEGIPDNSGVVKKDNGPQNENTRGLLGTHHLLLMAHLPNFYTLQ